MGAGLNKIRNRKGYINRKSYLEFIKTSYYQKYISNGNPPISYEEYIQTLKDSNAEIVEQILNNELGFKLPNNLGYIAINKFKQKKDYVVTDWQNSKKFSKFIPQLNLHTMGYMFKIKLFKNNNIKPLRVYFMQSHRTFKRELAKRLKEGKQKYLELDNSYFNKRFSIENIFKNKK